MRKKKNYLDKPRTMTVGQDTPESLESTDIAHKAIDVANAAINGTGANVDWDIPNNPEQAKLALAKYKAAIAALNAANGIVNTKMKLFKLMDITGKAAKLRKRGKKL